MDRSISAPFLEGVIRQTRPLMRRILGKYRIPAHDGEDLVQQTLLALVDRWESVRFPVPWVIGTLRQYCLLYHRERRRRRVQGVDAEVLEWLAAPVQPPQERAGMLRDVERALAGLPERCRNVLRLRFGFGYNPAEVALRLGYSPASMGKVTHRCLRQLHRILVARGARPLPLSLLP